MLCIISENASCIRRYSRSRILSYSMWLLWKPWSCCAELCSSKLSNVHCTVLLTVTTVTCYLQVPEKILVSAAHLLLSLLTSVRPADLYNSPLIQRLYADGITVTDCPQQVHSSLFTSASFYVWCCCVTEITSVFISMKNLCIFLISIRSDIFNMITMVHGSW